MGWKRRFLTWIGCAGFIAISLLGSKAAFAKTTGEIKILVVPTTLKDQPPIPYTKSQILDVYNRVGNYVKEASYGKATYTVTVAPEIIDSHMRSDNLVGIINLCGLIGIPDDVNPILARMGYDLTKYDRVSYLINPANHPCDGIAGVGDIGTGSWKISSGSSPATIILYFGSNVVAHETGHNLGLFHDHATDCIDQSGAPAVYFPWCSDWTWPGHIEYGNTVSVLGNAWYADIGHYSAANKERLGWLMPKLVTTSGDYSLDPYETTSSGTKTLEIVQPTGSKVYMEYRQPIGMDAFLTGNTNMTNGIVFTVWADPQDPNSIFLVDQNPGNAPPGSRYFGDFKRAALEVGNTWKDPISESTFTVKSASGSGATVNVAVGNPPACSFSSMRNPVVLGGTAPESQVINNPDYQTSDFFFEVDNTNVFSCQPSTYNFSLSTPPKPFSAWFWHSLSSCTTRPQDGCSADVIVQRPQTVNPGIYDLTLTATDASNSKLTGSGKFHIVVVDKLEVDFSSDKAGYSSQPADTATFTIHVTDPTFNNVPIHGAEFHLRLTDPTGAEGDATPSGLDTNWTDEKGNASITWKVPSNAALGKWLAYAYTDADGVLGESRKNFTVFGGYNKFADFLYQDLVGRAAGSADETNVANLLKGGKSYLDAANAVEGLVNPISTDWSQLGVAFTVTNWYNKLLRRAPDAGGLKYWSLALQGGTGSQNQLASFLTSDEYMQYALKHQSCDALNAVGQRDCYIKQIFADLLNRAADSGALAYWRTQTIPAIAAGVVNSAEFKTDVVTALYGNTGDWGTNPYPQNLLRRTSAPTASEVSYWVNSGSDLLKVATGFAGSPEYFNYAIVH